MVASTYCSTNVNQSTGNDEHGPYKISLVIAGLFNK